MAFSSEAFRMLWSVLQRTSPIAFSSNLARLTGNPKAGLLLSQMVYWTRRGITVDGWFFKTSQQWRLETGLSRDEQDNARLALKDQDYIEERRMGARGSMHFRLKLNIIGNALSKMVGQQIEAMNPLSLDDLQQQDSRIVRELLGRQVAYHRILREVTGNVITALLLSRMIYLQKRAIGSNGVWFSQTSEDWFNELGISRRQLDRAREKLRELNLINERLEFFPYRRVFVTLDTDRLHQLLLERTKISAPTPQQGDVDQTLNLKNVPAEAVEVLSPGVTEKACNQTLNQGLSPLKLLNQTRKQDMQPNPQSGNSDCGFGEGQIAGLVKGSLRVLSHVYSRQTTVNLITKPLDYKNHHHIPLSGTTSLVVVASEKKSEKSGANGNLGQKQTTRTENRPTETSLNSIKTNRPIPWHQSANKNSATVDCARNGLSQIVETGLGGDKGGDTPAFQPKPQSTNPDCGFGEELHTSTTPPETPLIFPKGLIDQDLVAIAAHASRALPHRRQPLLDEFSGRLSTARNAVSLFRWLVDQDLGNNGTLILERAAGVAIARERALQAARQKAEAAQKAASSPQPMPAPRLSRGELQQKWASVLSASGLQTGKGGKP